MRAVASFGDDPTKIEVIFPPGDPQIMLAQVATKPNVQLFGTALSYSDPADELAKRSAQPASTLIEMGVPYCFHVPDNAMIELKDGDQISHLVFKKVWTGRTEGSSDADYRSPTHVLYHNNTSNRAGLYRYSLVRMFFNTAYAREMLTSKVGGETARGEMIARAVAALNRFVDIYRVVTNNAHMQRLSSVYVRDIFMREHNIGFLGASFGRGIGTAVMNRSEAELVAIVRKAATGEEIPPWRGSLARQ